MYRHMIDHIIFDWDGTLAKTLHLWLAGYRIGLESQQHTFPDSIIARDFFMITMKDKRNIQISSLINYLKRHILTFTQIYLT